MTGPGSGKRSTLFQTSCVGNGYSFSFADHETICLIGFRTMKPFCNIAAYKFAPLSELDSLRARLKASCVQEALKGTILLTPEGINLFLSGRKEPIDRILAAAISISSSTTIRSSGRPEAPVAAPGGWEAHRPGSGTSRS